MPHFDSYATEYERALAKNLRVIPGGTDYYFWNRVSKLSECWGAGAKPETILDFGGGIGLAIPFLKSFFPQSEITITDESTQSLEVAASRHPFVKVLPPEKLPTASFDVAFVAGVLHHVAPPERVHVLRRLIRSVKPGGLIIFFELNPVNPVTRRLVRMCPFDDNAVLMKMRDVQDLCESEAEIVVERSDYMVFFPPIFKPLLRLERLLRWCPLGAQYFVSARRQIPRNE